MSRQVPRQLTDSQVGEWRPLWKRIPVLTVPGWVTDVLLALVVFGFVFGMLMLTKGF